MPEREDREWPDLGVPLFPVEQHEQSLFVGGENGPRPAQVSLPLPHGNDRVWRDIATIKKIISESPRFR